MLATINAALPYLAATYVLFLVFHLIKFTGAFFTINQLKKDRLLKPNIDIRIFVNKTVLHLGIKKKVQVWLSENIDVPSVVGFFKPFILLPVATVAQLNTQQLEAIILHELAHIKRQDLLLNLLQIIAKLILFFNPFANYLYKQIEAEREHCCDDWVLDHQYNKETYASALLQIETLRLAKIELALAATNDKKLLLGRIKRMFSAKPSTFLNNIQKIQVASISLILTIAIILFSPVKISTINNTIAIKNIFPEKKIQTIASTDHAIALIDRSKINTKKGIKNKAVETEKKSTKKDNDYSVALINQDLLQPTEPLDYTITTVSEKEKINSPKYFVKIEEERSGVKNNNVYYFQLSRDSGKNAVKPLIFLKQPAKKVITKKLPDTLSMPGKRVTT
jgi:beta-lactamase regulating signal transducer with metallopeptidase domain